MMKVKQYAPHLKIYADDMDVVYLPLRKKVLAKIGTRNGTFTEPKGTRGY